MENDGTLCSTRTGGAIQSEIIHAACDSQDDSSAGVIVTNFFSIINRGGPIMWGEF